MLTSRARFAISILALVSCCAMQTPGAAATWRWSGLDPTSSAWTRPGNWDPNSQPANDGSAALVFGDLAASARHDPFADLPWNLATLDLDGDDPYTLAGARLSLHGGITMGGFPPAGLVHRVFNDVELLSDNVWSNQASGSTLSFSGDLDLRSHRLTLLKVSFTTSILLGGDISGTGGLVMEGDGIVRLSGNNSYSGGTTMLSGLLLVESAHAIPPGTVTVVNGNLNLGTSGNVLGPGATAQDGLVIGGSFSASSSVTGFPIKVSSLGDSIVYDATGAPGESLLNGIWDLASPGGSRVVRIEDTPSTTEELTVLAQIVNPASIPGPEPALRKRGPGRLILGGMNTYRRALQVEEGELRLHQAATVGASGTGDVTVVLAGAALELAGPFTVPSEPLRLSGSGVLRTGALRSLFGSQGWGGPVALLSDVTIDVSTEGDRLTITGDVSGSGGLEKIGDGALVLTAANSYQGDTSLKQGTLRADNASGHAIPGALTVESGATLAGDGSIEGATLVESGGTVDPASFGVATSSLTSHSVTFSPTSTLHLRLVADGSTARLDALGSVAFAGQLEVELVPPYVPGSGHAFTLVGYASRSGQFGSLALPPPPSGLEWSLRYGADTLVLIVSCPTDGDGDGLGNACDCAPADPGAFAVPREVGNLRWVTRGTLAWESAVTSSGALTRHDVMRGSLAAVSFLGTGPEDACLADGLDATQLQDPSADPPLGSGYFYLIRGSNTCGDGRYETATDGQDRLTTACGSF